MEIPSQVEWILTKIRDSGFEAYAVGGCVRDALLGRTPEDWDITTSARPDQVKRIFGRTIDTGLQHGTVTVLRDHVGYEITTYRIDGEYEDGRHPKEVSFTADLREDLRRRDFTINAMAYSHETGVVDIFGGMEDLKNRILRCVGDPMERFTEDALRILRAVRFSAQLDFAIENHTYEALPVIAPSLSQVSKERIQAELTKTLLSDRPKGILLVRDTGMDRYLTESFPAIFQPKKEPGAWGAFGAGEASGAGSTSAAGEASGVGEASAGGKMSAADGRPERAARLRADKALRWAAFLSACGEKTAGHILRELKLDNETITSVKTYVEWMARPFQKDPVFIRKAMSRMSDELFDGLLELKETFLKEADASRIRALTAQIRNARDCIRRRDLRVTGTDLIEAGMKPGPELGMVLDRLFEAVLEKPERNEREWLLRSAARRSSSVKPAPIGRDKKE